MTITAENYQFWRNMIDFVDEMFGELPDGAYWATCEEMGVGVDVQTAVEKYEQKHKVGCYKPLEAK